MENSHITPTAIVGIWVAFRKYGIVVEKNAVIPVVLHRLWQRNTI